MTFDYKGFFGEIPLTQDLMSRRTSARWRLTRAAGRAAEHHGIVLYLGCNVLRTSHMIQTVTADLRPPRASTTSRWAARPTAAASCTTSRATPRRRRG